MKKLISLALVFLILLTVLSGCAPEQTTGSTGSESSSDQTSGGGEKVVLTAALSMDKTEVYKEFIASYENKYPNVKIDLVSVGANTNEYMALAVQSDTMPDIFSINSDTQGRQIADEGWIMDLRGTEVETLVSPMIIPFFTSDTGLLYGVPYGIATVLMYYNADMFEENDLEIPTNWSEFLDVCATLKSKDIAPISLAVSDSAGNTVFSSIFANLESVNNPDWESQMMDGSYKFADGAVPATFAKYMELVDNEYLQEGAINATYQDSLDAFNQKKTAMYIGGSWFATSIEGVADFALAASNVPYNDAGTDPYTLISPETGWGGSAKSEHQQEILNFIIHFVSDGKTIIQNGRGSVPITKDTTGSILPDVLSDVVPELLKSTKSASLYFVYLPTTFQSEIHKIYQELMIGATTPEEAANTMQTVYDSAFKD
ncbi:MAG: extracellular solute-binding protein [Leucobacter sp.]|nr:extracellular solute-binding protein [Leucobacter sp.]